MSSCPNCGSRAYQPMRLQGNPAGCCLFATIFIVTGSILGGIVYMGLFVNPKFVLYDWMVQGWSWHTFFFGFLPILVVSTLIINFIFRKVFKLDTRDAVVCPRCHASYPIGR